MWLTSCAKGRIGRVSRVPHYVGNDDRQADDNACNGKIAWNNADVKQEPGYADSADETDEGVAGWIAWQ